MKRNRTSPHVAFVSLIAAAVISLGCDDSQAEVGKQSQNPAAEKAPPTQPIQVAQAPVQGPAPAPEQAKKENKTFEMDWRMELEPLSVAAAPLPNYKGKKLIVYYFSATCPHCQESFPHVQELAMELNAKGVTSIAVATGGNRPEELEKFIKEQKVKLPLYKDTKRELSRAFGNGYVPLVLTVDKKGKVTRFEDFDEKTSIPEIRKLMTQDSVASKNGKG